MQFAIGLIKDYQHLEGFWETTHSRDENETFRRAVKRIQHPPAATRRKNAAHGASRGSAAEDERAPEGRKRICDRDPEGSFNDALRADRTNDSMNGLCLPRHVV